MKRIVYTDGPSRLELPDGLGDIERDVPREVPDELADALVERGDFQIAEEE